MTVHRLTVTCDNCGGDIPARQGVVDGVPCVASGYCVACGFLTPANFIPDLRPVTGASEVSASLRRKQLRGDVTSVVASFPGS